MTRLPTDLHAAYAWTLAAGELAELADLDDAAARTYADESEANALEHGELDVAASDLLELRDWLRALPERDAFVAREMRLRG